MAEGKNKVIVYTDWIHAFEALTDEEAGKLIKHFFKYVNDQQPVLDERILQLTWIPIEATLKRDLKKWEKYIEKQSVNGKKGGRPSLLDETQKTQAFFNKPKKAVKDSVSVRDSVSVNVKDSVSEDSDTNQKFEIDQCLKIAMMDERWVKENSATENQLFEFNKYLIATGETKKLPIDYKRHFHHWKKKKPPELAKTATPSYDQSNKW